MRLTRLLLCLILGLGCSSPPPGADADTVVLVHGLGRTQASMVLLGSRLEAEGFRVVNFSYPSTREPIESLVARLADQVAECCASIPNLHFVTHSMGGILVRMYMAERSPGHSGRVVMLTPPNQGSEVVDAFADSPLLERILGPSGARLGTDSLSVPSGLGPVDFELGIITGNRSLNPITSRIIPGPDDGKVAVERAWVEGASAFLVAPHTHTFITNRKEVADECVLFLRTGQFSRDDSPEQDTPD